MDAHMNDSLFILSRVSWDFLQITPLYLTHRGKISLAIILYVSVNGKVCASHTLFPFSS